MSNKPWKGKGSWTRVNNLDRYGQNYDAIFRKNPVTQVTIYRCNWCGCVTHESTGYERLGCVYCGNRLVKE